MTLLTKAELFEQRNPQGRVEVPWLLDDDGKPKEILVQGMSARARDAYARMLLTDEMTNVSPRSYIFIHSVVNKKGALVYSESDLNRIADQMDVAIIDLVVAEANRLSDVSDERKASLKKSSKTALSAVPSGA